MNRVFCEVESVPSSGVLDVKDAKGINKTDAAALAGRFGLACPVYQIMHLSCPLCLAQRNWRICRSLAGVTKANQEVIVSAAKPLPGFEEVEELN